MDEEERTLTNNFKVDEDGQAWFVEAPPQNYFPVASDYGKIPNRFIERYGNISYMANLGMMLAIQTIEKRKKSDYAGTEEGLLFDEVYRKASTDYSDGLVSCIPISKFINTYNLNKGGRTYQALDELYNTQLLMQQWYILHHDADGWGTTGVLTGTYYSKKTNCLYMKFNPDLEDYLLNIKKDFSRISFKVLAKLKDDFAVNLYQILKERHDKEQGKNSKFGYQKPKEVTVDFGLDELLFFLNIYPVETSENDANMLQVIKLLEEDKHKLAAKIVKENGLLEKYQKDPGKRNAAMQFKYFRRYYLDKIFKRINGFTMIKHLESPNADGFEDAYSEYEKKCLECHPTDIHVRYSFKRGGKGAKVETITFHVSPADWSKYTEIEKEEGDIIDVPVSTDNEEEEALIEKVAALLQKENIDRTDIRTICQKADWDEMVIENAYGAALQQMKKGKVEFVPFMIKAVEGKWKPNLEATSREAEGKEKEHHTLEEVKEQIGYEDLIKKHPENEEIIEALSFVMFDTLSNMADIIEVGSAKYKAEAVKERILSITGSDIENAVEVFIAYSSDAPTEKYLLSLLYNSHVRVNLSELRKKTQDKKVKPEAKKKEPRGRFTDFPQREYSVEELAEFERKKLGLDKK